MVVQQTELAAYLAVQLWMAFLASVRVRRRARQRGSQQNTGSRIQGLCISRTIFLLPNGSDNTSGGFSTETWSPLLRWLRSTSPCRYPLPRILLMYLRSMAYTPLFSLQSYM